MHHRSVLISGIGIAGSTLAYWLAENGFESTLVERAPQLRGSGYVIDFWGVGYDIAERMGLVPDLRLEGYDVQEVRFVDGQGRRIGGFDADVFRSVTNGCYVSLARGDLAKLLYRKIEGRCEVIFNDAIVDIRQDGRGVWVAFQKARSRRFDLLIGADGLHSVVRKLVFGSERRFEKFLGYMAAAFELKGYRPRDMGVYLCYATPGKQVARFAMRDDRTVFLFVFATDQPIEVDPLDTQLHKEVLRAHFGGEGWECPRILDALDTCNDVYLDRVSQIRMNAWSRNRVALIGDAAFCPSLLAGQGAALAMAAAYVLAGELYKAKEIPEIGLQHYEHFLRSFIMGKQDTAEQFARCFTPQTRLGLFLRNLVTRTFAIPFLAKLAMGRIALDRLDVPDYSFSNLDNYPDRVVRFDKTG
jgi:2-polyprenyl-6-methoxyphenol hydroxylase-like FAD-dependent oxidoreductase